MIQNLLPENKKIGILTINASTLSDEHLRLAGVPSDTPIGTTEGGKVFTDTILEDREMIDVEGARRENVEAAVELVRRNKEVGAILLECTNMTPYARDIHIATGMPVFSIETLVRWLHSGLLPKKF